MKLLKLLCISLLLINGLAVSAQTEKEQIETTLMHYIEGTANGQPERLAIAFHPDFNLYSVTEEDKLKVWEGTDYVAGVKPGKKANRIGKIISIDYTNNAATAKVEILIPGWRVFTDYFLLLKYEGAWKIIHKSYTWQDAPKE